MKSRFTALDIRAIVAELQELVSHGLRVVNVYDVDNKTYLIRLAKPDMKRMLLFESGIRLHSTDFEWPKPTMPSQFSLKCRKHLKSRRLASVQQLGDDRIVDLQFGSDEAAYHMIVELYDRGNVVLTDHQYTILNLLRRRMDNDDVRFAVRETYPVEGARKAEAVSKERLLEIFQAASVGDTIRKLVSPHYVFGPQLMDHCLRAVGLSLSTKVSEEEKLVSDEKQEILFSALSQAEDMMAEVGSSPRGFIIQKERKKPQAAMAAAAAAVAAAEPSGAAASEDVLVAYDEFHPFLFTQHQDLPHREFSTFNQACDEYFSKQEEQKIDVKQHNQEKQAVKKLDNVRKDLKQRVDTLTRGEEDSQLKAGLIEMNIELVESARMILNSELARATDWSDIATMIREAKTRGSATAMAITDLHFERNSFTIALRDPYEALSDVDEDSDDEELDEEQRAAAAKARAKALRKKLKKVEIDLAETAHSNAKHYYDTRRFNAHKKEKTIGSSAKALKSAERKTKQTLKDSATITNIRKSRKFYWFEKFLFFISSENFMIIAGRDQQQNEIVVRRYMKPGDIYVHANLHGASSCIIKNPSGAPIPPKTLEEAGVFALCHSAAWQAKIVTSAWWVYHHQVSKTAPTGEYLTTGSFMIRGKKNFLPPAHLAMGFGFLFKLDESCVAEHLEERRCHPEALSAAVAAASAANVTETATAAESTADMETTSNFPDTMVDIRHTGEASKFQYQISVSSTASDHAGGAAAGSEIAVPGEDDDETLIYLGDDQPIRIQVKAAQKEPSLLKSYPSSNRPKDGQKGKHPQGSKSPAALAAAVTTPTNVPEAESGSSHSAPKRGKRAKLRKAQERYADQDEEEKTARMRLLQSTGPSNPGKKEKGKKARNQRRRKGHDQDDDDAVVSRSSRGQQAPSLSELLGHHKKAQAQRSAKLLSVGGGSDDDDDSIGNRSPSPIADDSDADVVGVSIGEEAGAGDGEEATTVALERLNVADSVEDEQDDSGDGQQATQEEEEDTKETEEATEQAEAAMSDDEPGVDDTTPAGEQDSRFYSSFTGCPREDDLLLFAIPVVSPYNALQNYRFKVKLTPGNNKRGRAAKSCLENFLRSHDIRPREKDLLRVVKDNDMSRAFPGPVTIAGPQQPTRKGKSGKY